MTTISDDREFRAVLDTLDATQQRLVAARFVASVLPLCSDARIDRALDVAANSAAPTPHGQLPGGSAWQAAMRRRLAQTSGSIASGEDTGGPESGKQYRILSA